MTSCPHCGAALSGLGRFCHVCQKYTDEGAPEAKPAQADAIPDDRLEDQIELAIRRTLEAHGFHVYVLSQNRATRQTAGLADLYAIGHGVCAWIEVKREKGVQSEAQELFEERVDANGGQYYVMRHELEAHAWAESVKAGA